MKLQDAINLINHPDFSTSTPTTWADFGSGTGLFTNALAALLMSGSKIYAIDKKINAFKKSGVINDVLFETIAADFTADSLPISDLDGILMANSLHFVTDKSSLLQKCSKYFKIREVFLIVEYDTDTPNPWVPYPVSFKTLKKLFLSMGFGSIVKVGEIPSKHHGTIYASLIRQ